MMVNRNNARRGTDWQRALYIPMTVLAWLVVVLILGWLLGHIVKTILTLVLSGVVAFALTPLVNVLERRMPRPLAITLAYILGFGVVLGLLSFVVVTAADQVTVLVKNIPSYAKHLQTMEPQIVRLLHPFGVTQASFKASENKAISAVTTVGQSLASQSVGIVTSIVGTVVDIILVLILSVYLTANGPRIAARLRSETPSPQRRNTAIMIAIVNQVVGGYIRGTLTLATLIGVLVGVGMLALHVPYAILLGILAFFMEFIPVVGVLISGAASVLVALTQGWVLAVIVLGYFVVVHVIEGDLVGPRIMGKAVGIHPATALIALVAGTELFGVWGALFGSPLAGLLQAIGTAAYREFRGGDPAEVLHAVENTAVEAIDRETEEPVRKAERDADRAESSSKDETPIS